MSSQLTAVNGLPVSIGTIGTVVQRSTPCTLHRVVIGGTYVGTVNFHDANAAAGTSATSSKLIVPIPGANFPSTIECGFNLQNGLVTEATGTPVLTFVVG